MSIPPLMLRSAEWFGTIDKNGFIYRSWMKNQGIPDHEFQGKPVIGICNTWSELTPCNGHFRKREAPRHPLNPQHPATRAGLIETALRVDPLVLRWGL